MFFWGFLVFFGFLAKCVFFFFFFGGGVVSCFVFKNCLKQEYFVITKKHIINI